MRLTIVTGFFLPVPPVRGGSTEKVWFRLAREFAAAGHDVTFVSRHVPGFAEREHVDGISHIRLPGADHSRSLVVNLWRDLQWGIRVSRVLPPADIVICNTVTLPVWLGKLKPSAGRVAAVLARMPKGHGLGYSGVDLLLSLSEAVSARVRAENPRLASRLTVFPYPIDWQLHADARSQATTRSKHDVVTIGYVGRIHREKGVQLLLAAAARLANRSNLPAWRIELTGPASVAQGGGGENFRASLQREFGATLGSRLAFLEPEFDSPALARRYAATDVFCYPSVAEQGETFGVAVAEAMAAGCAPVVSQLACFDELVCHGETGLMFDHRAPDAADRLAGAVELLVRERSLRGAIAKRAQQHAQQFDYSVSARTLLRTLAQLAAAKTPVQALRIKHSPVRQT